MRLDPEIRDVLRNELQRGELIVNGAQKSGDAVVERRPQRVGGSGRCQRMAYQQRGRLHVSNSVFELTQMTVDELFACHTASVRPSPGLRNVSACVDARSLRRSRRAPFPNRDANVISVPGWACARAGIARDFTGIALALTATAMGSVSLTIRVLLLLAPLANFAGHVKCDDVLTSTAELNRCLTAVRVALTRRGIVEIPSNPPRLHAGLRTRLSRQV